MHSIKTSTIAASCAVLSACATQSVKMYEGPEAPLDKVATFRVYGPSVIVRKVDGESVENFSNEGKVSKAYILPGKHTFNLYTFSNVYWTLNSSGYNYAYHDMDIETIAGHTYIFSVEYMNESVTFKYEDKGLGYNPLCLEPNNWAAQTKLPFMKSPDAIQC